MNLKNILNINMDTLNDTFVFDIEQIVKFCSGDKPFKRDDIEITEVFTSDEDIDDLSTAQKQVREIKSNDATTDQSMRYELVKMMMDYMMQYSDEDISKFGGKMVLKTMLNNNLVKKL